MTNRPSFPLFTLETARQKVRAAPREAGEARQGERDDGGRRFRRLPCMKGLARGFHTDLPNFARRAFSILFSPGTTRGVLGRKRDSNPLPGLDVR